MLIIPNSLIPFPGYKAINLFGLIFIRQEAEFGSTDLTHELIHTKQQQELLFIFFYLAYIIEYLIHLIRFRNPHKAYRSISFEREAYANQSNPDYLQTRQHYSFFKYKTL